MNCDTGHVRAAFTRTTLFLAASFVITACGSDFSCGPNEDRSAQIDTTLNGTRALTLNYRTEDPDPDQQQTMVLFKGAASKNYPMDQAKAVGLRWCEDNEVPDFIPSVDI